MSQQPSSPRGSKWKPEEPDQLQQRLSNHEKKKYGGGSAANAEKTTSFMSQKVAASPLPQSDSVSGRQGAASTGAAWGTKGPPSPARMRSMTARTDSLMPLERTSMATTLREPQKSVANARWEKATNTARLIARRSLKQQQQGQLPGHTFRERHRLGATPEHRLARNQSLWQPVQLEESDSDEEDVTLQELRIRKRSRVGHLRRVSSSSNQWNMLKTYLDALKKKPAQPVFVQEEQEVTCFWRIKVSDENAKFFEAVRQNNVDNMNAALALGADPTARDEDGYTALHIAVEVDSLAALHALLLAGDVAVSARDTQGVTPLHLAVEMGKRLLVNALIMAGARIDAVDRFGRNPLHYAIRGGKVRIVKLLLYCGADPNMPDSYGTTPLSMAVLTRPFPDIARSLLGAGALVDVESGSGVYLLSEAVLSCFTETHLDAIRVLVESGAEVNRQEEVSGHTALHLTALSDNGAVAEVLLENGADPMLTNYSGETPVEMALLHGSRDVLAMLAQRTIIETPLTDWDMGEPPTLFGRVDSIMDELFNVKKKQEDEEEDTQNEARAQVGIQRGKSGIVHSVVMERTPVAGPLAGVEIPEIAEKKQEARNKKQEADVRFKKQQFAGMGMNIFE